jgi:hypothetical protein
MDVLFLYIDFRLDLNFICLYGYFLCVYVYDLFIAFVLDDMWSDYSECVDYVNVILLYEKLYIN